MSHSTRSNLRRATAASAPAAESTASTSCPARPSTSEHSARMPRSSSTTRILLTSTGVSRRAQGFQLVERAIDLVEQGLDRAGRVAAVALDHLDHPALERQLLRLERAA